MGKMRIKKYASNVLPQCSKILYIFGIVLTSSVFVYSKILRGGDRFFADFTLVEGNKRITKNCIGNFTKVDLQKCISKCISHDLCLTFNFNENLKICELLDISKFDQLGLLEYHRGWNHYETDSNQKKLGEICEAGNLCKEYETCEVTFDSRYYICRCPDGFNGTKCEQYIGRGSTLENPAQACFLILNQYDSLSDGYYWLKKEGTTRAAMKYCRRKEYTTALKWSPWNDCIYPGHQNRTRECHDPRTTNRLKRNCEDEVQNRTCFTLPASCNEIKKHYEASRNGLYKINLTKPVMVYCDMETEEGGWMLVVNVTIDKDITESEAVKISAISSTNIEELYKAENENFLFDIRSFKNIDTSFKQLRFFCQKKGKTIHIYTVTNVLGKAVMDYFFGKSKIQPKGCNSYERCVDDNSYLSKNCEDWYKGAWGLGKGIVFEFPFFIQGPHHFGVSQTRFECDDSVTYDISNKGVWKIYIR